MYTYQGDNTHTEVGRRKEGIGDRWRLKLYEVWGESSLLTRTKVEGNFNAIKIWFYARCGGNFRSRWSWRIWPMKSAKKISHGIVETLSHNHRAYVGLLQVLCIWYGYYLGIFVGFLTVGVGISLILLPALWTLPPVWLPCPASIWRLLLGRIVLCFVLFVCSLLETCSFLKIKQRESGSVSGEGRCMEAGNSG